MNIRFKQPIQFVLLLIAVGAAACKKDKISDAEYELEVSIQTATDLLNAAVEGVTLGQYAPGSKATLQTSIDWASFIKSSSGNDEAYENARKTLDEAIETFKQNTVKPGIPKFIINSYFELGAVEHLIPDKSAYTIEVKARLSDLNTDGSAKLGSFITIDDRTQGILFRYTSTGAVAAFMYNGSYMGATTAANTLTVGKWYHLTYTFNGSTITIYVDGVKKAGTNVANGPKPALITAGSPVRLGMARNNQWNAADLRSMHGNLKDVRFWNYALTEAEVKTYMNTITGAENGLLAYWPFDLNLGSAVPAAVGSFTAVATNITWE